MARRRLIDPGIWHSGHYKRLNFRQRLLWKGVITHGDDEGKLKGEPAVLKADVFPFDSVSIKTVESDLRKLEEEGLIKRYEVDGDKYLLIVKWDKYQKPSHPTPSKIPDPPQISGAPLEMLRKSSRISQSQVSLGKDREVEFKVGQEKEREVEERKLINEQTAVSASALSQPAKASPAEENSAGKTEHDKNVIIALAKRYCGDDFEEFASQLKRRDFTDQEIKTHWEELARGKRIR